MTDLETAVEQLNAVALEDFVAERKRLAKALRDEGDRASAAELAKLPKPSAPAWSLNLVAREQPQLVSEWIDTAQALRDESARADRASGDSLRAAMTAHRDATRRLLGGVRAGARPNGRALTEPLLDRVRELLQAATADPARAEQLRAARVVEGGDEPPPLPPPSAAAPKTRAEKPGKQAARERAAAEQAKREAEARAQLERLVDEAELRAGELRARAGEAQQAAIRADERLEQARQTLHRSESEADAARQAADEAAEAAEQAERELRTLAARLAS